jgi:transposase
MKTYSLDLRQRVVAAVDRGEFSQEKIAELFEVGLSWIKKLLHQRRELGHIKPLPHGGGNKPLLDGGRLALLRSELEKRSDATLKELCQRVRGAGGKPVSLSTMSRTLAKLGFTRKKEGALGSRAKALRAHRPLGADGGAAKGRAAAHFHR